MSLQGQTPAGLPASQAAAAVAVTSTSTVNLLPPNAGQVYRWAIVNNVSPWLVTLTTAGGIVTIQPYGADLVYVTGAASGIPATMSVPPGGSATAPRVATYLQANWFLAGGGPPPGTYPLSLTAQAIAAVSYLESLLATVAGGTGSVDVAVPVDTQSLIILVPGGETPGLPVVTGDQSSEAYPVTLLSSSVTRWVSNIDPAKDTTATVSWTGGTPAATWYVLASPAPSPLVSVFSQQASGTAVGAGAVGLMVAGSDGNLQHNLLTDTSGRLVPPPAIGTTYEKEQALSIANPGSVQFGPTTAGVLRWLTLSAGLVSATVAASALVRVQVQLASGTVLAELLVAFATGAQVLNPGTITLSFPEGVPFPSNASGAFILWWGYVIAVPTAIGAAAAVTMGT